MNNLLQELNLEIKKGILSHALLFNTNDIEAFETFANEFMRMLFCQNNAVSDDGCTYCRRAKSGQILDYRKIGNGYTTIKKESIQEIIAQFSQTAIEISGKKLYFIVGADLMTKEAANSLLKFLEEPPINTYAVLVTLDSSQVLGTIKSRCRAYNYFVEPKILENNKLMELLNIKERDDILLFGIDLGALSREEILADIDDLLNQKHLIPNIIWIELLMELKVDIQRQLNLQLAVEKFLIGIGKQ